MNIKTLILVVLVLNLSAMAQSTYTITLDRPAHVGERFEYVFHATSIDSMSMWYKENGELFSSEFKTVVTDVTAAAEVLAVNIKGEATTMRYTIGQFTRSKTEEKDGMGYQPKTTTRDTLIPRGSVLTMTVTSGEKSFKLDGVAQADSVNELWSSCFDNPGIADFDKFADWKKPKRVGARWALNAKKVSELLSEHSAKSADMKFSKAFLGFDSVYTYNDVPHASITLELVAPFESVPFPTDFKKMFKADSFSVVTRASLHLPLDAHMAESGYRTTNNMYMHGMLRFSPNTPEIINSSRTHLDERVEFRR